MQESSGPSEVFRQFPVPGSEHPADNAVEVLWRPRPRVQEVKERFRVTGGNLQCGEVDRRIKEEQCVGEREAPCKRFNSGQVQGGGQSKARPQCWLGQQHDCPQMQGPD